MVKKSQRHTRSFDGRTRRGKRIERQSLCERTSCRKHIERSCKEHDVWGQGREAAESWHKWLSCRKNPGHKSFIPAEEFSIEHLPEECRRPDFFKWIKAWIAKTVRLRVRHTSSDRHGYFVVEDKGGQRLGTGFVYMVELKRKDRPFCSSERRSNGSRHSWIFHIATALHVVYDEEEIKRTLIDFNFDSTESKKDGKMKTLKGLKLVETCEAADWCRFTCECDDSELASQMLKEREKSGKLGIDMTQWVGTLNSRPSIIISHPHGRPKKVTVGEARDIDQGSSIYSYTTDTCAGSSGAFNLGWSLWSVFQTRRRSGPTLRKSFYGVHHSRGGDTNKGYIRFWRGYSKSTFN